MNGLLLAALLACALGMPLAAAEDGHGTILRIAEKAHGEIAAQLDGMGQVPPEMQELFERGTVELGSLREAAAAGDPEAAERHFHAAMDAFRRISYAAPAPEAGDPEADLDGSLERAAKYVDRLRRIAAAHGEEIDFGRLDGLVELAGRQIGEGDHEAARGSLAEINRLAADVKSRLDKDSQSRSSDRAVKFAQKHLDRLDAMIDDAEELGYPPEMIGMLRDARGVLEGSSDTREIIETINWLLSVRDQIEETRAEMISDRLDVLEERAGAIPADHPLAAEALAAAGAARLALDAGELAEAQSALRELATMLDSLEG
ncbi:hypothetical protein CENSYa_1888 [Cenarchaeum symbiosum A]|uniref:Uncharacterized protein n=1 Tax=Cenarchaeum symbiosum (strain A) TaxID=414004 RepID=A0RYT0_CENSY|nr:hypothetical protein CENSYa_1888 [Cenarchaeum symbiosum A]